MFERILVAVDGGEQSKPVLEMACALADKYDAKLGIVYVAEPQDVSDELVQVAEIEGVIRAPSYSQSLESLDYMGRSRMRDEIQHGAAIGRLAEQVGQQVVAEAEAFTKSQNVKAVKTFVRSGDIADGHLADLLALDTETVDLMNKTGDTLLDCFIFCGDDTMVKDVWSAGRHMVRDGRHVARAGIEAAYRKTATSLMERL